LNQQGSWLTIRRHAAKVLSFAEMVLFGLIIALAARSQ
jgi:hypothetical protein